MSFFTFLTDPADLFPECVLGVSYGSVTDDFPYTNLQTSDISQLYITTAITGGFDLLIEIDLVTTPPWNQVVIINHDIDPSAVVTVRSGPDSSLAGHTDVMPYRQFDMFFRTASTRTDRYVEIHIHDTISAAHSVAIGRIMVGLATTLTSNFSYDWRRRRKKINRSKRSDLNARSVDRIVRYLEFVLTFEEMTDAQLLSLTTFTDSLEGDAIWFFLILDPSLPDGYVVTLSTEVEETINRRHTVQELVFSEESRGLRIGA